MPIYAQLVEAVRRALATGRLAPGDQLPTVRQLAVDLKINPNTVARAYSELERAGAIATKQGRGTFVLDPVAAGSGRRDPERLMEVARRALVETKEHGFSPQDLIDAIRSLLSFPSASTEEPGVQENVSGQGTRQDRSLQAAD